MNNQTIEQVNSYIKKIKTEIYVKSGRYSLFLSIIAFIAIIFKSGISFLSFFFLPVLFVVFAGILIKIFFSIHNPKESILTLIKKDSETIKLYFVNIQKTLATKKINNTSVITSINGIRYSKDESGTYRLTEKTTNRTFVMPEEFLPLLDGKTISEEPPLKLGATINHTTDFESFDSSSGDSD